MNIGILLIVNKFRLSLGADRSETSFSRVLFLYYISDMWKLLHKELGEIVGIDVRGSVSEKLRFGENLSRVMEIESEGQKEAIRKRVHIQTPRQRDFGLRIVTSFGMSDTVVQPMCFGLFPGGGAEHS